MLRLTANPHGVPVEGLRVGYFDPEATLARRKAFFLTRSRIAIFGFPQRGAGGVSERIDGPVDSSKPIDDVYLDDAPGPRERVCVRGGSDRGARRSERGSHAGTRLLAWILTSHAVWAIEVGDVDVTPVESCR